VSCRRRALGALIVVILALPLAADCDVSARGTLTLVEFGPEYAVYVTRADGHGPSAYMTRRTDGPVTLEWSVGLSADAFHGEARRVTLDALPEGAYTVQWWNGQVRSVGKTLLSGVGSVRQVTVGARPGHVTLEPPDGIASPTRLNVVWGEVGEPNDVSVYVDDVYVGHAFDSAELSVFGLPKGERHVRVLAPGYRPVDLNLTLSTRNDTTRFVRMRRLGADL